MIVLISCRVLEIILYFSTSHLSDFHVWDLILLVYSVMYLSYVTMDSVHLGAVTSSREG